MGGDLQRARLRLIIDLATHQVQGYGVPRASSVAQYFVPDPTRLHVSAMPSRSHDGRVEHHVLVIDLRIGRALFGQGLQRPIRRSNGPVSL